MVACLASLVDACAWFVFLFLPANPETAGRVFVLLLVDPITCIIGYCLMFRRLYETKPIWAELGFYPLILGSLLLTCQIVLGESARLSLLTLNYSTANDYDSVLELLVTFTLPFGLAIYAWLIATSPPLRRWLGFMIGVKVIVLFIAAGSFAVPRLSDLVSSKLFAVYAIILSVAKAVWFLSPTAESKYAEG